MSSQTVHSLFMLLSTFPYTVESTGYRPLCEDAVIHVISSDLKVLDVANFISFDV